MTPRRIQRTLLLDADDTLWENNIFYLECTERFLEFMESLGFDRVSTTQTLSDCEHLLIPKMGYGPESFIEALGMSVEQLTEKSGRPFSLEDKERARSLGKPVRSPPMILLNGIKSTLEWLWPTTQLILVTKGVVEHQESKVAHSGLRHFFDAVCIVPEKDTATFQRIVSEYTLAPNRTWVVGNSPKSDINPAIRAGLGAIFIPHQQTWVDELQVIECPNQVIQLAGFKDLMGVFGLD